MAIFDGYSHFRLRAESVFLIFVFFSFSPEKPPIFGRKLFLKIMSKNTHSQLIVGCSSNAIQASTAVFVAT